MKIEIWSDFTCPFCYLGKRRLELAIEQFGKKEAIHIEYKSFELDPNANKMTHKEKIEVLMEKYQMNHEKVLNMAADISEQGKEVGIYFDFDNMMHTNTHQAHRLVKYSYKNRKDNQLIDLLFKNYFSEHMDIGNRNVLVNIATEVGLDAEETDGLLCLNKYSRAVQEDQALATELGIQGVPFFIFDETYAVSGAQSVDVFLNVLTELWNEEDHANNLIEGETCKRTYCVGNDCETE